MSDAEKLNQTLHARFPALGRALSPLGRWLAFPKGIPYQSTQAKSTRYNATIGQVTDGHGGPMPLALLQEAAAGLDPKHAFLYEPQPGDQGLRELWRTRQMGLAGRTSAAVTLPIAVHGLSHGLNVCADLLTDADTTVLLPDPCWENYYLIFGMRSGAPIQGWPLYNAQGRLHTEALAQALASVQTAKAAIVLNFPSNPTGYSPDQAELDALIEVLSAYRGTLTVIVDDAYQGVVHEKGPLDHSIFWQIRDALDPDHALAVKVDGATKELMLFPSRLGFVTLGSDDAEVDAAWTSKVKALLRGTVGSPPGPSTALVLAALRQPERLKSDFQTRLVDITRRYHNLRAALAAHPHDAIRPLPFNSAFFALMDLDPAIDAEQVRLKLIAEHSVGTVVLPGTNAVRIAYCSTADEDVGIVVEKLVEVVRGF